jgi:hypothetical protein
MSNRENKGGRNSFGKRSADPWEEKDSDFKMPKSNCAFGVEDDYGAQPISRRLSSLVEDTGASGDLGDSLKSQYWQPGPIKRVGDNARPKPTGYSDTHPVKANSPSGKYGKPGGKGQRSGA